MNMNELYEVVTHAQFVCERLAEAVEDNVPKGWETEARELLALYEDSDEWAWMAEALMGKAYDGFGPPVADVGNVVKEMSGALGDGHIAPPSRLRDSFAASGELP